MIQRWCLLTDYHIVLSSIAAWELYQVQSPNSCSAKNYKTRYKIPVPSTCTCICVCTCPYTYSCTYTKRCKWINENKYILCENLGLLSLCLVIDYVTCGGKGSNYTKDQWRNLHLSHFFLNKILHKTTLMINHICKHAHKLQKRSPF